MRFVPPRSLTGFVHLGMSLSLGFLALNANALDLSLNYAKGDRHSIQKMGMTAGWQHPNALWQGQAWQLQLRHEVELAHWQTKTVSNIVELGYTPVLRLQRHTGSAAAPQGFYAELAIGVRLLSSTRIHTTQSLSTAFQFSDMVGLGYQWGAQGRHTVGVRYQHLSNAGIKQPNPGINFATAFYRHSF